MDFPSRWPIESSGGVEPNFFCPHDEVLRRSAGMMTEMGDRISAWDGRNHIFWTHFRVLLGVEHVSLHPKIPLNVPLNVLDEARLDL